MNKLKLENGITNIALIITIIILLILVGISISALVGDDGIITKATESIEKTELATVKEVFETALVSVQTEYYEKKTTGEINENQSEYIKIGMIRSNLSTDYQYCYSYSAEENVFDDDKALYDMSKIYLSKKNSSIIYELSYEIENDSIVNLKVADVTDESLLKEIKLTIDEETLIATSATYDTDDVLLNPGKGFVLRDDMDDSYDDVVSIVYYRFNWCAIEPEEGLYNWDLIDEKIEECISRR